MDLLRNIKKAFIEPLQLRLRLMVSRGIITLVNDAAKLQELQVDLLAGETVDQAERFQQYGFTSHPFSEAEAVALFPAGDRSHCLVIAVDDRRYRLKNIAQGEVALYDDQGQAVHLKRDKHIHIYGCDKLTVDSANDIIANTTRAAVTAAESCTVTTDTATIDAETKIVLDTPLTECTGNLSVAGGITSTGSFGTSAGKISTPGDIESTDGNVSDATRSMSADRAIYNNHTHKENGSTTDTPKGSM